MSDMASKYRAAADRARSNEDAPTADWLDTQADWWTTNHENAGRIQAAMDRLETGHA